MPRLRETCMMDHTNVFCSQNDGFDMDRATKKLPARVRYRRKSYPIIDTVSVGGRRFFVSEHLRRGTVEHMIVFDRTGGSAVRKLSLRILPKCRDTWQRLEVLRSLAESNSHLPTIVDWYGQRGKVYVLTTWIEGESVKNHLRRARNGHVPWPSVFEATNIFSSFTYGLVRLTYRDRDLVHGDIKPGNLILSGRGTNMVMIDFGCAWPLHRTRDRALGDGISKQYAAPELQSDPARGSHRSDQFSTMVAFYEMLTGNVPYDGLGGQAAHLALTSSSLTPPSQILKSTAPIPRAAAEVVDRICRVGLALDPSDRYGTPQKWLDEWKEVRAQLRPDDRRAELPVWIGVLRKLLPG